MAKRIITDGLRQKANGVWERAEIINGKRRWFSSLNPEEVWKKRNAALGQEETEREEKDKGPLFETVADAYESKVYEMKYGTTKVYLPAVSRAKAYFSGKRMREIEPYMISQFLQSLSGMAQTTVSNQKTVINAIFRTWIESPEWKGDNNPALLITLPRGLKKGKRLPPTEEQVKLVKDHYLDPDALPAVVFLCTGERRGEACGIQIKDINFERNTIKIKGSIEHHGNQPSATDTKTPAGVREIPLLNMLKMALAPYRDMPPDTYILSGTNKPLTASQYRHRWTGFWKKYGMAQSITTTEKHVRNGKMFNRTRWKADVCAHQFRHEYVCMLVEAEVPEEIAIQLVGHANSKMIHEVYMSLKPSMINKAREKLEIFLNETQELVD